MAELGQTIEVQCKPTLDELLSTIINRNEVEQFLKQPVNELFIFYRDNLRS